MKTEPLSLSHQPLLSSRGDLKTDYLGCKETLENAAALKLKGVVVYVEGEPAAFILGTISRGNLFGVHFAKALHKV
ncbi:MAG: hypothetical protein K940chlam2_00531 [Chlamydiae bacterium]|nr:hypothetical protein [Chlamydiota bacterium]